MKIYREWQISGDTDWLKKMYPLAKQSMDFSIHIWDPDHLGVLIEPHHNTYDIEFWGPDGMCSSFYLGALSAMAQLSTDVGLPEEGQQYSELALKGAQYLDDHLFNGEYYEHKIMTEGLRAYSQYLEEMKGYDKKPIEEQPEEIQLLLKEGPKYQYGTGCISDGVMGNWLSEMCYVESSQTKINVASNLDSIFKYNFKHSLWDHANPQRPGFALGDEPGLLLCTWPKGGKPSLPFVYSDEVFTGIEYQVASHLIMNGRVDEGLSLVWATRSRFDGRTRNPWNEYECGSYYARAMASYSLLFALSGIQYSAPQKKFTFAPRYTPKNMKFFFALGSAWGSLSCTPGKITINLSEGSLDIDQLEFMLDGNQVILDVNTKVSADQPLRVNY